MPISTNTRGTEPQTVSSAVAFVVFDTLSPNWQHIPSRTGGLLKYLKTL